MSYRTLIVLGGVIGMVGFAIGAGLWAVSNPVVAVVGALVTVGSQVGAFRLYAVARRRRPLPPFQTHHAKDAVVDLPLYSQPSGELGARGGHQAQIVVHRAGGFWRDSLRKYKVDVDGRNVGTVAEYDELHVGVRPGTHQVQVRLDWASSRKLGVAVAEGEVCHLWCRPGSVVGLFGGNRYVTLEQDRMPDVPIYQPPAST